MQGGKDNSKQEGGKMSATVIGYEISSDEIIRAAA
jgi:hypothetical protein